MTSLGNEVDCVNEGGCPVKKLVFSSCFALLFLISACTSASPSENSQRLQGTADQQDGIILNSEGNFTGASYRSVGENGHNLGTDEDKIREIVRLEGLEAGMVIIAGSHAWVNVTFPEEMEGKERDEKLTQLYDALQRGIPRYQVHVNPISK